MNTPTNHDMELAAESARARVAELEAKYANAEAVLQRIADDLSEAQSDLRKATGRIRFAALRTILAGSAE